MKLGQVSGTADAVAKKANVSGMQRISILGSTGLSAVGHLCKGTLSEKVEHKGAYICPGMVMP